MAEATMYNFSFPPIPNFILLISPLLPIFAVFFLKVSHIMFNWRTNTILLSPIKFFFKVFVKKNFFKSQTKTDAYFEISKIVLNSQAPARTDNPRHQCPRARRFQWRHASTVLKLAPRFSLWLKTINSLSNLKFIS